jgi:hypothetical protein
MPIHDPFISTFAKFAKPMATAFADHRELACFSPAFTALRRAHLTRSSRRTFNRTIRAEQIDHVQGGSANGAALYYRHGFRQNHFDVPPMGPVGAVGAGPLGGFGLFGPLGGFGLFEPLGGFGWFGVFGAFGLFGFLLSCGLRRFRGCFGLLGVLGLLGVAGFPGSGLFWLPGCCHSNAGSLFSAAPPLFGTTNAPRAMKPA